MGGAVQEKWRRIPPRLTALKMRASWQNGKPMVIEFMLSVADRVTIRILDVSGHTIATPLNDYVEAGVHRRVFDTRTIAPGCHVVELKTDGINALKNVAIVR
jgi:hypothetical protein